MGAQTKAPLFTFASPFVQICQIGTALAAAIVAALIPLSILFPDRALSLVNQHFSEPFSTFPLGAVTALLAMALLIIMLTWFFLRTFRQIIVSVKLDDPFTLVNAHRFTVMAWLMLAIQVLKYPAAWLGLIVETAFKGPTSEVEVGGTLVGLLTVVTLFMLASVFRHGAAMRDDLEGTV